MGIILIVLAVAVGAFFVVYVVGKPTEFTISVDPTSDSIHQGDSDTATVSITSVGGYAETVSLTASGQPSGVTVSFNPSSSAPSFDSTITISVGSDVASGTYTLTITGTGGDGKTHTCAYALTVTLAPDFTIDISPSSESVAQGGSTTATVSITQVSDYSQTVSLTASGQPSGVTVGFSPSSGTPSFNSTMSVNVGASASAGTYEITITGTGADAKVHSCTYSLTVTTGGISFTVYSDAGFPSGTDVYTWSAGGLGSFNGDYTGETPPEGNKCFETNTNAGTWAGWGVIYMPEGTSTDLSSYAGGYLKFWVKTQADLKVEIKDTANRTKHISAYGWDSTDTWQEISIPINDFGANLSAITYPFMATIETSGTFYVDYVRWVAV